MFNSGLEENIGFKLNWLFIMISVNESLYQIDFHLYYLKPFPFQLTYRHY